MLLATTHLLSLSLLLATAIAAPSPTAASSAPIVSNPATGVSFKGSLSSGIESFLNIRFGENTSGANRFALPKHFSYPHHTVVDASAAGAACPQSNTSGIIPSVVTSVSEDCLTLRVDRLANTTEGDNLPVMIWVFGGGFTTGQIYNPDFNPTALLKSAEANGSPFIYAAVNYRLGFFGFLSSPALAANHSLNAGLEDQRLGMEWIKKRISLFGGDPKNITVFGESAGAISIGHQINLYGGTKPVPFHRAIMQSGASTTIPGTTGDICLNHMAAVTQLLNCTSTDSGVELDCLRAVPLDVMLPVVSKYELSINVAAVEELTTWQPIAPSRFIPDAPSKLVRAGRFAKNIDMISGWNENDGAIFIHPNITTDAQVVESVVYPAALDTSTTNTLLSLYPLSDYAPQRSGNNTATAQFFRASQMWRDTQFLCPAFLLAQANANRSRSTTTSNFFVMNTTLYTPELEQENKTYLGVIHSSDIPCVFDTAAAVSTATTVQRHIGDAMSASWAAFASSGNVSHGSDTLPGWTEGYQRGDSGYEVRIIGGPNDGMAAVSSSGEGVLASEDLIERCAFWNSQSVQDQLQH